MQQGLPSDLQLDVPHAHAQRQEAVYLPRLRKRILPQLRLEEAHEKVARFQCRFSAAATTAAAVAVAVAAATANPPPQQQQQ